MAALVPWSSSWAAARRKLVPTGVSSLKKSGTGRVNVSTGIRKQHHLSECLLLSHPYCSANECVPLKRFSLHVKYFMSQFP